MILLVPTLAYAGIHAVAGIEPDIIVVDIQQHAIVQEEQPITLFAEKNFLIVLPEEELLFADPIYAFPIDPDTSRIYTGRGIKNVCIIEFPVGFV